MTPSPPTPSPTTAPSGPVLVNGPYSIASGQEVYILDHDLAFDLRAPSLINSGRIIIKNDTSDTQVGVIDSDFTYSNDSFVNTASGSLYVNSLGLAYGVQVAETSEPFFVSNAGLIQVVSQTTSNLVYGVSANNPYFTLHNAGQITAWAPAPYVFGVWATGGGDIENAGTISATTAGGQAYGVRVDGFDQTALNGQHGTIINSGTITAQSDSGTAIGIRVNGKVGATVGGTVVNSGTITAQTALLIYGMASQDLTAYGTKPVYVPKIDITNTGTINGVVDLSSSGATLHNAGTINGNLLLGYGSGFLDTRLGTINGVISIAASFDPANPYESVVDTVYTGAAPATVELGVRHGEYTGPIRLTTTLTLIGSASGHTTLMIDAPSSTGYLGYNPSGSWTVTGPWDIATAIRVQNVAFSDRTISLPAATAIVHTYETFLGRDPTQGELAYWDARISDPSNLGGLGAALLATPGAGAYTTGRITSLYEAYFGRDPTSGEINVWQGQFENGADYATLRAALVADATGKSHTNATVTALYDAYFGRDPNASELSVWQGLIAAGTDFTGVRAALLADPGGQQAASVTALYETYFGRDPTNGELAVWRDQIAHGATLGDVRAAVIGDASGKAHTTQTVTALYDTYFGRDPTANELNVWRDQIAAHGADFSTVRTALAADSASHPYTSARVTSLYDTYFGRDPTAQELNVWWDQLAHGADFGAVRAALVGDPSGQTHTAATITSLYDTYFGRDPSAQELAAQASLVVGGEDFTAVRASLTSNAEGQAHTAALVIAAYDFANPTPDQFDTWESVVAGGADPFILRVAIDLPALNASSGVRVATGTAGSDTFAVTSASHYWAINKFDPAMDSIHLSAAYSSLNLLDAAHAHQFTLADGTPGVVIEVDESLTTPIAIVLTNTRLGDLHSSDFIFT